MCEHCGCRGIEPIAELMDEHYHLLDEAHRIRRMMAAGDRERARQLLDDLVGHLDVHVRREEAGIFRALRERNDYLDEVEALEREHDAFDAAITALDPGRPDFERSVSRLLVELDEHVERENLGIFPVSVVTLGAKGWERVARARSEHPTFLHERTQGGDTITDQPG
ncbi:hemerythrin domain-containing protein [Nocardioides sp. MH1]|uniref:hemerythrin domain-containing protein n=1 Tax=Nocardioides sp. MH1 TaxID=3242490 RepID=UPI003520861F